jgi:diguanylate cyclase (GGDEF)-like protein
MESPAVTSAALPQAPAPRLATSEAAAWLFCALGLGMVVALVALRGSELAAVPVAVMGAGAALAAATGRVRNRPQVGYPWVLFSLACVAFILGAVLRQALEGSPLAFAADAATLSGYAATLGAFIGLLRCRQSHDKGVHELVDGAIVLVSVGAAALAFFTLPTAENVGFSVAGIVQGAYPVVDAVMIFVAILLSWTSARRVTSFWLLGFSVIFILVGDIGYASIGTVGKTVGSPLLDLPFVVAFTLFGAAALHPSMRQLSSVQQRPVPAWSRGRVGLLVPVLLGPPLLALVSDDVADTWVGAVSGGTVTLLLLVRAVTAVQANARAQEGLRYQATHDQLTRLVNRPRLLDIVDELLARAAREGDRVDVLFLDLDSFKLVNDTWGHQVGDRVLRLAAQRLLTVTRPEDTVARIGGDEFVLARYVGQSSAVTGEQLAADVVEAFRAPLPGEDSLVTTVSIGLAGSARDGASRGPATAESLLRDADTAMYRAKAAGRNRVMVFDPAMHDSVRHRVETELALRYALDRSELLLHYQPVVSVQTGEVVGAEALLRWAHPALGLVSPLEFIPIAEETGLIVEIGEWVVSEALRQAARWRDQRAGSGAPDLWIAVNVSARQLRDPSLVDHVEAELARHGVPAELLVLEITESAMMADEDVAASLLHRLRSLGLTLAVDDFGTGYSSLGHLRRFPVSKVKIDRAFVSGIEHDADDAEIVRAVVAMSLAMHLDVVAEGIETAGQRDLLQQLGVQLGQGWHFGRPKPAEDCEFVQVQTATAVRAKS